MKNINPNDMVRPACFGHRKVTPRACVADSKKHLRLFLADALEELGFITSECGQAAELAGVLDMHQPDLVVLGVSGNGVEIGEILEAVQTRQLEGTLASRDEALAFIREEYQPPTV